VNNLDVFIIEYPDSEDVQLEIARKFQSVSEVNFSNCAGAIDGILIWILKPSEEDAANAGGVGKSFFVVTRESLD
jgi:O-glycosyl hydrolase